jgi:hypothetical protein
MHPTQHFHTLLLEIIQLVCSTKCDYNGNVFIPINYSADGTPSQGQSERSLVSITTVPMAQYKKHNEMRCIYKDFCTSVAVTMTDFSTSSSEDDDDVGNVAVQQPKPCLWTLPPKQ